MTPDPLAALLHEALNANALRVESNRGGYPRHEAIPSEAGAIDNLAASLAARLADRPLDPVHPDAIRVLLRGAWGEWLVSLMDRNMTPAEANLHDALRATLDGEPQ